jgi:hypothetical protein
VPFRCNPGDWFAVPLPDGTWTVGQVARRDAWAFLGYFFGPRRLEMPIVDDVSQLNANDAVLIKMADIYPITTGMFPKLGRSADFDPTNWPFPPLGYRELGSDECWKEECPDGYLTGAVRKSRTTREEYCRMPQTGISSPLAVTSALDRLLLPASQDAESVLQTLKFHVGDWCGIPMPENRWVTGRIVHHQDALIVGYFFGPRRDELPAVEDLKDLSPARADEIRIVSDLGLQNGDWPVLGGHDDFKSSTWIVPAFGKRDWVENRYWRIVYSGGNVLASPDMEPISFQEYLELPQVGLVGHRYIGWFLHWTLPWADGPRPRRLTRT